MKRGIRNPWTVLPALALALALAAPALARAKPDVKVHITAEKEITVEKDGRKITRRVPAKEAAPGEEVIYTLHYENKGDEPATNVELVDPLPSGMVYVDGSAFGPGARIEFSIDGGKTYKKPSLLTYKVRVGDREERRLASPEQYTHIRWTIRKLPPGKSGTAGFRARLK